MPISRWRTCGIAATVLTEFETSRVLIGPATSWPSTVICGPAGSVPTAIRGSAQPGQHSRGVGEVDPLAQQPPGQRAVHGAGVQVAQPELDGDAARRCRLAGAGRAVHGDHQAGLAGITLHFVHAGRYHPGG